MQQWFKNTQLRHNKKTLKHKLRPNQMNVSYCDRSFLWKLFLGFFIKRQMSDFVQTNPEDWKETKGANMSPIICENYSWS